MLISKGESSLAARSQQLSQSPLSSVSRSMWTGEERAAIYMPDPEISSVANHMADPDQRERLKMNYDVPPEYFRPCPNGSQENGIYVQEYSEAKGEISDHLVPAPVQFDSSFDNPLISNNGLLACEGYTKPLFDQQFYMSSNVHPENLQFGHLGATGNQFLPVTHEYPFELQIQSVPYNMVSTGLPHDALYQYFTCNMVSTGYPHSYPYQEFQYFVVIDFEATCDQTHPPWPQEIIEFPSVLVNAGTGQLEASFQTYVRPTHHQLLTDFCKDLTGIQQIQVDRGVSLSEALLMHDKWLEQKGVKHTNFAVVTWGDWDCRVMLDSECKLKKIRKPSYFNRWINLQTKFIEIHGGVRCTLKHAVESAGLVWEGRPHCGLDDALNTARLLTSLMHHGARFTITDSLTPPSAYHSSTWCPYQPRQ